MTSDSGERLCVLCNTENTVKEKNVAWFCEGPPPKILGCSACKGAWYEWKGLDGFTIIMGASDYKNLHKKLRPDFTPLELLSGFIIRDEVLINVLRLWYKNELQQILEILEPWVKFNIARRVESQ